MEPQILIDGVDEVEPGSEVALGGSDGGVPQQKLNLLEAASGGAA